MFTKMSAGVISYMGRLESGLKERTSVGKCEVFKLQACWRHQRQTSRYPPCRENEPGKNVLGDGTNATEGTEQSRGHCRKGLLQRPGGPENRSAVQEVRG